MLTFEVEKLFLYEKQQWAASIKAFYWNSAKCFVLKPVASVWNMELLKDFDFFDFLIFLNSLFF